MMLKRNFLLLLMITALLMTGCHKGEKVITVKGSVRHCAYRTLYLGKVTPDGIYPVDSCNIRRGKFALYVRCADKKEKAAAEQPAFYRIYFTPENALTTLLRSGESITLDADASNLIKSYSVSGAHDAELMAELDHRLSAFIQKTDSLTVIYDKNIYDDNIRTEIENAYNVLADNHTRYLQSFIEENKTSLSVLIAFYQRYNRKVFFDEQANLPLLKQISDTLTHYYPDNENVIYLNNRLEILKISEQK